jgi:23S rRNA pseudouridine1911/1915/1917 synthase
MDEPEKQEVIEERIVPDGYREHERLDVYLTRFLANATRNKVQHGIREGRVEVNGAVVRRVSHPVQAGDRIVCRILRPPPMEVVPEPIPLDIVYEDEHLIVLDKAAGLVVHPAYGNRTGTLVHALLWHVGSGPLILDDAGGVAEAGDDEAGDDEADDDEADDDEADDGEAIEGLSSVNAAPRFDGDIAVRPGIVHRLDKDTSGLMVVAKSDLAHQRLARQFADRTIRRRYEALVWGHPEPPAGRIEASLGRDPRDRRRVAVVPEGHGKHAITHYETLEPLAFTSHVAFRLETGRTHQIRVHARHMGHPVLGDATYGGTRIAAGPDIARRRAFFRNLFEILPRQALHARTLGFVHPVTGESMDFESALPDDMARVLVRLREGDPG